MTFPQLAETFKAVAKEGKKGFYTGRIAEEIVRLVKDKGGCMTMEDLAAHETEKVEPITYSYQGQVDVHEVGTLFPLRLVLSLPSREALWLMQSCPIVFSVSSQRPRPHRSPRSRHPRRDGKLRKDPRPSEDGPQLARVSSRPHRGSSTCVRRHRVLRDRSRQEMGLRSR
jgi:hypothetical protein